MPKTYEELEAENACLAEELEAAKLKSMDHMAAARRLLRSRASLKGYLASANDKALLRGRAAHDAQEKLRAAESALAEARGALRVAAEELQAAEVGAVAIRRHLREHLIHIAPTGMAAVVGVIEERLYNLANNLMSAKARAKSAARTALASAGEQETRLPIDAGRKLVAEARALYKKYAHLAGEPVVGGQSAGVRIRFEPRGEGADDLRASLIGLLGYALDGLRRGYMNEYSESAFGVFGYWLPGARTLSPGTTDGDFLFPEREQDNDSE